MEAEYFKVRRIFLRGWIWCRQPDTPDRSTTGSNAPQEPERTLERAIGTQIRDLRQRFHLSVGHLANAASISSGMLSKIENGQTAASLSTLQALAQALNVPIPNLFAAFEEKPECSFVKAGQGVAIERRGS